VGVVAKASPLKIARSGVLPPPPPEGLSSTTNEEPPFHAAISPADWFLPIESVATMNFAVLPIEPPTGKAVLSGLKTCPVGLPPGTGTVRSRLTALPLTPPL
jgi:hypothetical protein